jgi:hypothetical protein
MACPSPVQPGQYAIKPAKGAKGFVVYNTITGKIHSYHTTKKAAKHQKQLLYAVGHGWKPTNKASADLSTERCPECGWTADMHLLMYPES